MQKDFDKWNKEKKKTNAEQPRLYTVREIWWCRLGVNVGSEQDGSGEFFLRPIIIVRGLGPDTCLVIPLTTSHLRHPLRIRIGKVQGEKASAILSQIRVVDTRRLVEKIGFISGKIFGEIRRAVKTMF
jgi:mRNA-degrading endonuclease toxin of MazEF toxin-antitoxin module